MKSHLLLAALSSVLLAVATVVHASTSYGWLSGYQFYTPNSINGFGSAAGVSGSTVVVGNSSGLYAQVYSCGTSTSSTCTPQAKITGPASSTYGYTLALSSQYLVVGATTANTYGAAYIYPCTSPTACTGTTSTTLSPTGSDATGSAIGFGGSAAISGNLVLVGTYTTATYTGYVYVYWCGSATTCGTPTRFASGVSNDLLGFTHSLALSWSSSQSTAIVALGARHASTNGVVYVMQCYQNGATGSLCSSNITLTQTTDTTVAPSFGSAVAISGALLAASGYTSTVGSNANQGIVTIFECTTVAQNAPVCSTSYTIVASGSYAAASAQFGFSLSMANNLLVVGAINYNSGQGAVLAYSLTMTGSTYLQGMTTSPSSGFGQIANTDGTNIIVASSGSDSAWFYQGCSNGCSACSSTTVCTACVTGYVLYNGACGCPAGTVEVSTPSSTGVTNACQAQTLPGYLPAVDIVDPLTGSDQFGFGVAVSGTTAAVGSIGANIVYIYSCSATSTCTLSTNFGGPSGSGWFGTSLAFNLNMLVVGAYDTTVSGYAGAGSVYIYSCTPTSPSTCGATLLSTILHPSPATSAGFGLSVDMSGDFLVVGASSYWYTGPGAAGEFGTAWGYWCPAGVCGSATALTPVQKNSMSYASSVSVSGSLVAVGASYYATNVGQVFIYSCPNGAACTNYTLSAPTVQTPVNTVYYFGTSVSIMGGFLAVGAPSSTVSSLSNVGAVYLFSCSSASCGTPMQIIDESIDGVGSEGFGYSVSLTDSILAVGFRELDGSEGGFDIFTWSPGLTTYTLLSQYTQPVAGTYDFVGAYISTDGFNVLTSAYRASDNGGTQGDGSAYYSQICAAGCAVCSGSVNTCTQCLTNYVLSGTTCNYAFSTCPTGTQLTSTSSSTATTSTCTTSQMGFLGYSSLSLSTDQGNQGGGFGSAVAINWPMVVVGSWAKNAVYVYTCTSPSSCTLVRTIASPSTGNAFGFSLALSSNYLIVGAVNSALTNTTTYFAGRAYVYSCTSASTCGASLGTDLPGRQTITLYGTAVAVSGNLVAVTASSYALTGAGTTNTGYLDVFWCTSASACTTSYVQVAAIASPANGYGQSVAVSGSLVAVGIPFSSSSTGSVNVYNCTCASTTSCSCSTALVQNPYPSTGVTPYYFGISVSGSSVSSGGLFAFGAGSSTVNGTGGQGTVFVYVCPVASSTPTCDQAVQITDQTQYGNYNAQFGWSVGFSGNLLVVGTRCQSALAYCGGGFQIYSIGTTTWPYTYTLYAQMADTTTDGFTGGDGVATDGTNVIVGTEYATASNGGEGIVYIQQACATGCIACSGVSTNCSACLSTYILYTTGTSTSGCFLPGSCPAGTYTTSTPNGAYTLNTCTPSLKGFLAPVERPSPYQGVSTDFAYGVVVRGSIVIVGDPVPPTFPSTGGQVFVFSCDVTSNCTQVAVISGSNGDCIGTTVSYSDSLQAVLIGSWCTNSDVGVVYTYSCPLSAPSTCGGTQGSTFTDPLAHKNILFGGAIAASGSLMVVGANGGSPSGAYVFYCSSLACSVTSSTTSTLGLITTGSTSYGATVAISGQIVAVGDGTNSVAYVYNCIYTTSLACTSATPVPTASTGVTVQSFGSAVSLSGTTLAIGASTTVVNGTSWNGAVYLFNCSVTGTAAPVCTQFLQVTDQTPTHLDTETFGNSVSVNSNGLLAVGTAGIRSSTGTDNGGFSIYTYTTSTYTLISQYVGPVSGEELGGDISTDGLNVIAGTIFLAEGSVNTVGTSFFQQQCHTGCIVCSGSINNCTTCVTGWYLYENMCYSPCPVGTYNPPGTIICSACSSNCAGCVTAATECTSCSASYYLRSTTCLMTATASYTESATRSATQSMTQSATQSYTQSLTHSATQSFTQSATQSYTPSLTHSATQSFTQSATQSCTQSATQSLTQSATGSYTQSATASLTQSATGSFTQSATASFTQSATGSMTHSATGSSTQSATGSLTQSATGSATQSGSASFSQSSTPSATQSATASLTQSATGVVK